MATALLLLDVQRNMLEPPEPVPGAREIGAVIADVLNRARSADAIVVHVRNNGDADDPDAPGSPGWQLVHAVLSGEHVVDKHQPDAFAETGLADLLPVAVDVIVVGMQSDYCVRGTSLSALRRGHVVRLVRGAHGTYDGETAPQETAARVEAELRNAGVQIIDPQQLLANVVATQPAG